MKLLVLMTVVAVAGAQSCSYRSDPELNAIIEVGTPLGLPMNDTDQDVCAELCCQNDMCNWYVHNSIINQCSLWETVEQRGQMPGSVSAEKGPPNPTEPLQTRDPNDAATSGPMVVTFVLSLAVSLLLYANDVFM